MKIHAQNVEVKADGVYYHGIKTMRRQNERPEETAKKALEAIERIKPELYARIQPLLDNGTFQGEILVTPNLNHVVDCRGVEKMSNHKWMAEIKKMNNSNQLKEFSETKLTE